MTSEEGNIGAFLVGDPIDVVTGANSDCQLDFRLHGPVTLFWRRYYSSARSNSAGALGWGHTHEYERSLEFDLDGIRYHGPDGGVCGFPFLDRDGQKAAADGWVLQRISSLRYVLRRAARPDYEFEFRTPDSPGLLRRVTEGAASISLRYDAGSRLSAIVDSRGRTVRLEYNGDGRLVGLFLEDARSGNEKRLLAYDYDEAGNLVRGVDPYGNSFAFRWDTKNRMIAKTDRRGYTFSFEYDDAGRCASSRGEDGLLAVRLSYRPTEHSTIVTKSDGGVWSYLTDQDGAISRIIDPVGGIRSFLRDETGKITAETDARGHRTSYVYDAAGALTAKVPRSGRRLAPRDPADPPRFPHWVAQVPFEFEYGLLLPLRYVSTPLRGNPGLARVPPELRELVVVVAEDFPGQERGAASSEVDDFGNLVRERFPDGTQRTWSYDSNGNVTRRHDRDGGTTSFEYVSWNLVRKITDAVGQSTFFWHTEEEQIRTVTDPGGATTDYEFDKAGRLTRVKREGLLREEYVWDHAGNLTEKRDGQGKRLLTFEIGRDGLPAVRRLASGDQQAFSYDGRGRFLKAVNRSAAVVFDYDEFGNRVRDQRGGRGVTHRYDSLGIRKTTILDRFVVSYEWDPNRRTVIDPMGGRHELSVGRDGICRRSFSNGALEIAQFDAEGRCFFKARRGSVASSWRISRYRYSGEGDLLEVNDTALGRSLFSYDPAHRVVSWQAPGTSAVQFRYDRAGNLLEQPGLSHGMVRDGNRLGSANGEEFGYDDRTNLSSRAKDGRTVGYAYDSRDFLIRSDRPEGSWEAEYDALGRRVAKKAGGKRHEYYWSTDQLAAEVDAEGRLRVFVYADPLALTPLLFIDYENVSAEPASGKRFFISSDHLGTPTEICDDSGVVVWSADFEPYGTARVAATSSISFALRFPGHYFDEEIGLHYNRFRYYDPGLGRYLQPDPLGMFVGGPNLYSYAGGNPVSRVDVRGLTCPNHPDHTDPDCEDCQDNEPTQIIKRPTQPDPDTVARCGEPSKPHPLLMLQRMRERPYRNPPEMYEVRPGKPLDMSKLDPNRKYLWSVAPDGTIAVAPERQPSMGRRVVHRDLTPDPDGSGGPGAARTAGELNYDKENERWIMNNDSSYTFAREDGTHSPGSDGLAAHDLLTQSGTDTSNIDYQNSSGSDAER